MRKILVLALIPFLTSAVAVFARDNGSPATNQRLRDILNQQDQQGIVAPSQRNLLDLYNRELEINGAGKCACQNTKPEAIKAFNKAFIEGHIERLEQDIREQQSKLTTDRRTAPVRDWQKEQAKGLIKEKEARIQLLQKYQKSIDKLHVKLILKDLEKEFEPGRCDSDEGFGLDMYRNCKHCDGLTARNLERSSAFYLDTRYRCDELNEKEKGNYEARQQKEKDTEEAQEQQQKQTEGGCPEPERPSLNLSGQQKVADKVLCEKGNVSCIENDPKAFLEAVGANKGTGNDGKDRDLSYYYGPPKFQGKHTSTCTGFAVGADMEAELYKKSHGGFNIPSPDALDVYAGLHGKSEARCSGQNTGLTGHEGVFNMVSALNSLTDQTVCIKGEGSDLKVHVSGATILKDPSQVDFDFFKTLIDHEKPVAIDLNTEFRDRVEDWVHPRQGGDRHAVAVVGYDWGVNPMTMKQEPYVIVRDSLNDQPRHMKIAFSDLKRTMGSVYKLNNVKVDADEDPQNDKPVIRRIVHEPAAKP